MRASSAAFALDQPENGPREPNTSARPSTRARAPRMSRAGCDSGTSCGERSLSARLTMRHIAASRSISGQSMPPTSSRRWPVRISKRTIAP